MTAEYLQLKVSLSEQAIEADPDNLDLYQRWADLNLRLADILGFPY